MSTTPPPRHFCPRCRHGYAEPQAFCSECGADMLRVSAIDLAAAREAVGDGAVLGAAAVSVAGAAVTGGGHGARIDRRISASNQAWLGRIVDGRYRVMELIGRGGMGVVYKVEHLRMGKIAAMKVLHRDLAEDPEIGQRFEREAAAVSRLDHPNTVHVFDFGTAGGALYLIMEYVRGADLGRLVERDGPMPFSRAAPLLIQILGALSEAHELGIVHRDLKPDNVLITRSTGGRDFVKVLDFGLAKMIGTAGQAADVSEQAQIVGTPYFMAPEQIRGDDVDPRTDVYSLGATMYRMLTGTHPFQARTAIGVLTKHLTSELEPPSQRAPGAGLTPAIDAIVRKAMAKDPADRWPSAAAMAAALEDAYADVVGDGGRPGRTGSSDRNPRLGSADDSSGSDLKLRRSDIDVYERSLRRQRLLVTGGAVLAALGLAAVAVWWTTLREPPPRRHEHEPNDTLADATRIAADLPATGYLGRRRSATEPDVDFFRVARKGAGVVTVRVSAVPNLDLTLILRDRSGRVLAAIDEDGVGGGEVTHRRAVDGAISVEVGQVMTGTWPIENVSDAYTLEVREETGLAGWEVEPNGSASDATPLEVAGPVRGYLDARSDVDAVRWDGADGRVVLDVAVSGDLPLSWRGPDDVERAPGRATVTLRHGDLLWLQRKDREQGKGAVRGVEGSWTVTATPAR